MILLLGGTGYVGQAFACHLHQMEVPVLEVSARLLLTGGKGLTALSVRVAHTGQEHREINSGDARGAEQFRLEYASDFCHLLI